jgi:hypothetical protein
MNGASNFFSEDRAAALRKLKAVLSAEKIISTMPIKYSSIETVGSPVDGTEIFYQQTLSSKAIAATVRKTGGRFINDDFINTYLENLGEIYQDEYPTPKVVIGNLATRIVTKNVVGIVKVQAGFLKTKILAGHKVILVAHSQGNLFAEAAMGLLVKEIGLTQVRDNLRVINLAADSAISPDGRFITITQDQAVNGKRYAILVNDGVFFTIPNSDSACLSLTCTGPASLAELEFLRADAHGFNEIYTNEAVFSLEKNRSLASLLAQYVQQSIDSFKEVLTVHSHFSFDSQSLADSVVPRLPLTLVNGGITPNWTTRGTSPAISLPSGQYLAHANGLLVPAMMADNNHSFSVATWVKFDSWAAGTNAIVYEREAGGGDTCFYNGNLSSAPTYGLSTYYQDGGRKWLLILSTINDQGTCVMETLFSTVNAELGRWYHTAATYDQTTGIARVYVDGQVVIERTVAKKLRMTPNPALIVGQQPSAGISQAINGAVDDLRFYRGALSQSEVAALVSATHQLTSINITSTGVDASGVPLPQHQADPHWKVVAGPGITNPQPAYSSFVAAPYYRGAPASWIWAVSTGNGEINQPYTFQREFDIGNADPNSIVLTGKWAADNFGAIYINGVPAVGTGRIVLPPGDTNNLPTANAFTITSGFRPGVNTISFHVTDTGRPGGLLAWDLKVSPKQ